MKLVIVSRSSHFETTKAISWNTHQLEVTELFKRRISFVAQFDSVLVFPVFDRRPMVNISVMGSVSTNGNS